MAFKIKDNLDLYGNQLLNFALQSDSGFPQSPQVGHMFNYTGTGVMANHAVMCVDETTKAFKALAFVDEIATNTAFTELAERVLTIEKALGEDTANVIDTWEEIQNFLKDINANDANLMTMLNSKADKTQLANYLPKSGGTIESKSTNPLTLKSTHTSTVELRMYHEDTYGADVGWGPNTGAYLYEATSGKYIGVNKNGVPYYYNSSEFPLLHSGNYSDYALPKSGGTITGKTYQPLVVDTSYVGITEIGIGNKGTIYSGFGYSNGYTFIGREDGGNYPKIGIRHSDGTPVYSPNNFGTIHTLIHSGNIGNQIVEGINNHSGEALDVQGNIGNLNAYYSNGAFRLTRCSGLSGLGTKNNDGIIVNWPLDHSYGQQWYIDDESHTIQVRYVANAVWSDWKTIAFTDSTVAAAKKLVNSSGASIGNSGSGYTEFGLTSWENYLNGSKVIFRNESSQTMLINSSGNVTIGESDLAGTSVKLFVSGDTRFDGQTRINGSMRFYGKSGISSDIYLNNQSVGGLLFTYSDKKPLLLVSSNIGIGTDNPQKKLHVVGDLYVDGNIIATKEVSAGGAGQEGESGDGGAEVISQQLAKGQSTYTITNTIKRSDIAVSLYEETVINSQTIWSLCLADIEVTNTTITVTFGSATSVNHKLVAVG